jgi:hypothetical protein
VWGARDFNNVQPIAASCVPTATTNATVALAGPLVNYVAIWIGALLLRRARTVGQAAWGFVLIFASLPFARLFTALVGGGDEMWVARSVIADPTWARLACIVVIVAILAWPLAVAWRAIADAKLRAVYFAGFLLLPMLIEGAVVLFFFNTLLRRGLLAEIWVMGTPALVLVVLALATLLFVALSGKIRTLVTSAAE